AAPAPSAFLDDVERAEILGYRTMPQIQQPRSMSGNGLPLGTWYYQVAAVTTALGESLPSREVALVNQGGTIHICWSPPPAGAADSYNLYRSLAADGRSGTERLLKTGITGTCFDDNGQDDTQALLAPAPGRLRG